MNFINRSVLYFSIMALLLIWVGVSQSWNSALSIVNLCIISAIMALGVNIQWGYVGLFNVGIMGFAALGGLTAVIIAAPPVPQAWGAGGSTILLCILLLIVSISLIIYTYKKISQRPIRNFIIIALCIASYIIMRNVFIPTTEAIEKIDPAKTGYLGGLGWPILIAWPIGGLLAGTAAWIIGKITLGLSSDYLAIATLGISEIIIAIMRNEDWLSRGVKNVTGLPRPVPYEINLQQTAWFQELAAIIGLNQVIFSSIFVKICYMGLFFIVLLTIFWLSQRALHSPWGRMMRAIRDNPVAANAMGKNVTARYLQVFVLGSIIIGIAGAMLVTLNGQLTPNSYHPLRFTFLIWVMVIVGGSGNNLGAILGGFLIWFFWTQSELYGMYLLDIITTHMSKNNDLRQHLLKSAAYTRLMTMGIILLVVLRFSPHGLLPERHNNL